MKKNIGKISSILMVLFVALLPMIVKADAARLYVSTLSENTAVGAEVALYVVTDSNQGYKLNVSYDSKIFDVASVHQFLRPGTDTIAAKGKISTSQGNGVLTVNYDEKDSSKLVGVVIKLRVKEYPSSGKSEVKVQNVGNTYSGSSGKTFTFKVAQEKQCPTCQDNQVSCPVCETCEKCEVCEKCPEATAEEKISVTTYALIGACIALAGAVAVLAFKKK